MTLVPNQHPTKAASRRLAIVGEAPGADESQWHTCTRCGYGYSPAKSYTGTRCPTCSGPATHTPKPFMGPSGMLLNKLLAEAGIERDGCFIGNVCQQQPPRNEIKLFKWDGQEIQDGLKALQSDLAAFQPHFCLLLGNTALKAFQTQKANVSDWRGSLFASTGIQAGVKCMAAYHPAALLREPSLTAATRFDFQRLKRELPRDGLHIKQRDVVIAHPDEGWTAERIWQWAKEVVTAAQPISFDIEGVVDYVECIGFAQADNKALVVPLISVAGESVWPEEDEYEIWLAMELILSSSRVPKIAQNSLYDCFVLAWSYGIVVRPLADDTMLKHHELYCELEKSLAFQASIYTDQPFYKFQRKAAKRMAEEAEASA
jgi:uracil-DNA glycosylase family 4